MRACFQEYLRNNQNLRFDVTDPNGMDHVQWVSSKYLLLLSTLVMQSKLAYAAQHDLIIFNTDVATSLFLLALFDQIIEHVLFSNK